MERINVRYNKSFDLNDLYENHFQEPRGQLVEKLWDMFVEDGGKGNVDENELICCLEDDFSLYIKDKLPNVDVDTINDDKVFDDQGNNIDINNIIGKKDD
tara:strand:+ start:832 stop:1131 length:300 start_codon:yes stop_codon:yes gene_type:complete